jgi:predicted site-specific integrase-resolvase
MASEGLPRAEEILCVRVPCRDGRERVWQAIKVLTTGTTAPAAAQSSASCVTARDAREESGGGLLKRAALYARVSTDTQEREETVASQVDLLQQAAETHGYAVRFCRKVAFSRVLASVSH